MPVTNYGVLKGKVVNKDRGKDGDKSPHFEIHVKAGSKSYRVAVNVQSQEAPSEVLFFVNEDFEWDHLDDLKSLSAGFSLLGKNNEIAIDYVRSGLFDTAEMTPLAANVPGTNNDLEDLIQKYVDLAIKSPGAMIYAFGSRFGPEKGKDKFFKFTPELGVHDIHMNQGNSKKFAKDDGVFHDGALFINLPKGDKWIAVFLAFQSQSFVTSDRTGHPIEVAAAAAATTGSGRAVPATAKPAVRQRRARAQK